MGDKEEIKDFVKKRYGALASRQGSGTSPSCCSSRAGGYAKAIGYSDQELESIPSEAAGMVLGCGNPTALAGLRKGEVVLDLGAGGGIDVFLAARRVGPEGYVIGVDMTDEMLEKATDTARRHGYENVEFRKGEIDALPVDDDSVDVIISNCVVNLAPDKAAVYRDALRVLKPGGRLLVSDLVTDGEIPEDVRRSFEAWASCIAGALDMKDYLRTIREAGFDDVRVVGEHRWGGSGMDEGVRGKIVSIHVEAHKRKQE